MSYERAQVNKWIQAALSNQSITGPENESKPTNVHILNVQTVKHLQLPIVFLIIKLRNLNVFIMLSLLLHCFIRN